MDKVQVYHVVDLFMGGRKVSEIAVDLNITSLEVMEILQSDEAVQYRDKIKEMKRMELDVMADGVATDVVRETLEGESGRKEKLQAADMTYKASGKYKEEGSAVATLAEILKRVMEDAAKDDNTS